MEADGEEKVYINGEQRNAGLKFTGKLSPATRPFAIGGLDIYPDRTFPGVLDEIRVYNRALTDEETQKRNERSIVY